MMNEPVSSIMSTKLVTVEPTDTLAKVKQIFSAKRIHHLPVVVGSKLVGIITTADLLYLNRPFDDYDNIRVEEVMTRRIATLEPDEKVGAAAEIFLENLFHAVPVVKDDALVGIVTTFDVLKYEFKKEYPNQEV